MIFGENSKCMSMTGVSWWSSVKQNIWLVIVKADMLVMDLVVVEIVLNVYDSMRFISTIIT